MYLVLYCIASKVPIRNEKDIQILQQKLLQYAVRQEQVILKGNIDLKGLE